MTFDPFAGPGPRWFSIDAHRPFLEDLADGVLAWLGEREPEALSDAVVLLPNRRAARAFSQALGKRAGDQAVLLPEVRPLGDLEEDEPPFSPGDVGLDLPPAIDARARRFELARLIVEEDLRPGLTPVGALGLADALGRFLDSCQIEEVEDMSRLDDLVTGDLARHWQETARFLRIATRRWPARLAELGRVDPAWRRARLLRLLAERWTEAPPDRPLLAAGSTGTAPAAAAVLKAVAGAPRGAVVVPGLDREAPAEVHDAAIGDAQHPQHALGRLLAAAGVARAEVRPWFRPETAASEDRRSRARGRVLSEALRPAEATGDWRDAIAKLREDWSGETGADPVALGLEGLSVVTARNEEDAAGAIALLMRETLETPGRTCALVTPDLDLSRRVAARLERWRVVADSSSGAPLPRTQAGRLLSLAARVVADPLDPQALLGLLKHPAVRLDLGEVDFVAARRGLEAHALRGPRLRDFARARAALLKARSPRDDGRGASETTMARVRAAEALLDRLEALTGAARAAFAPGARLDEAARSLTGFIEAMAGLDAWGGNDGEAAAALLAGLIEHGAPLGEVEPKAFARLLADLAGEETVRSGDATHPSLRILGAVEARLVRADRMILAGLEEGTWPGAAPTDPLLSRPMREAVGLPPPEKRLGQTAQDFIQAAAAPEVVLVERERKGGQPAVPSRWLWRLRMLAQGATHGDWRVALPVDGRTPALARALDAPVGFHPARRPAPTPPVDRRPRELPVTAIERWVRDPYAVYARYVLGLREMERPGRSAEALARGTAVHKALERLVLGWPEVLPDDCETVLHDLLIEELTSAGFDEAAMAREGPLARNCARTLARLEADRRARGIEVRVEQTVRHAFAAPFAPFTVTAKADRIEVSAHGAAVMDFKTGGIPSKKQIEAGFSPQLTLTGAILAEAGFADAPAVEPEELTYVRVTGRDRADEVCVRAAGAEAVALSQAALAGLKARVARFDTAETPYLSWVAPQFMGNFGGNYDHLSRVWEWHVAGGGEGDEA
ncbi:MAG TPA: double-strand break repair protein AddB [Brevundimonas sp.]|jgi:ATP-dependent helicase/nuclease subunit B|uniref:double-strand break repair protein AddB n=1 Tax=Brevundimonas sp. TaxID=1871086 RepID=UPI002DF4F5BA|nr:double-strand break repair protein AddB [Brevundimonas sp.]